MISVDRWLKSIMGARAVTMVAWIGELRAMSTRYVQNCTDTGLMRCRPGEDDDGGEM